jgi:hypothetical protein
MKKLSIFVLLALTISTISMAQTNTAAKKFNWGYKIGFNTSNIRIENRGDADWKTGLVTGLFFTVKAGEKLSIQPELLYSSMGGRNVIALESNNTSLRLNYFSIPVLAKYRIAKNWNVVVGPQVDVLIQAKSKNNSSQFDNLTNDFKESSFNATAGAELTAWRAAAFTVRYIYGFTNVADFGPNEMKNQGIQVSAAFKF